MKTPKSGMLTAWLTASYSALQVLGLDEAADLFDDQLVLRFRLCLFEQLVHPLLRLLVRAGVESRILQDAGDARSTS